MDLERLVMYQRGRAGVWAPAVVVTKFQCGNESRAREYLNTNPKTGLYCHAAAAFAVIIAFADLDLVRNVTVLL
jgi:hypothetical protein